MTIQLWAFWISRGFVHHWLMLKEKGDYGCIWATAVLSLTGTLPLL